MVEPQRQAIVAVVRRDGRFLVIRRGPDTLMPGYWAPPSGRVEAGESCEQAVVREVREEVGLAVTPVRKVWECPTHDGGFQLHWWLADASAEQLRLDPREVSEARWILPEEFADLEPTFEAHRPFFEEVLPRIDG